MKLEISCPRCGHEDALPSGAGNDWDEISCSACGEFIATRDYAFPLASRRYQHYLLSLSIDTLTQMSRSSAKSAIIMENAA
ncbi:hypothetical protein [Salinicola rhizosphaerae]|uniref:TFIIB-type domain-containing protein n=1 Tax=Salinicola rhizosphaerae TaxID=1443141 RepID=A0ABQ3E961_9GAMM|nr:hypothetical protein [Salinicola rhizosphaerae]GHB30326.1 hypothetical protein GCM10009038_31370 [Salinicola rhizosphaerae]